jgi:hypothetical protein
VLEFPNSSFDDWDRLFQDYLRADPTERSADLALVFMCRQGEEPENFKHVFPTWDDNMWKV